jgi:cyclopropane fatty-acyl-phospholipid synthase-like methyltransferase
MMQTQIKRDLKEIYNKYANQRDKDKMQEWKAKPRQVFLELIKSEGKKTLLEIGAGHGRDSLFFKNNGIEVTAIDLSDEMVKLCRTKGIEAYEMDFYNLSQLNKKFDAVWAMNSLLHVEKANLELVLKEINLILESSGLFFMGVWGGEDKEGIWEEDIYVPRRFYAFYTDESLIKVLKKHFKIISFEQIDTGEKHYFQSIIMKKK